MDIVNIETHVFQDNKIIHKPLKNIIMGLYKLFDEGIVNCRDHAVRQQQSPF